MTRKGPEKLVGGNDKATLTAAVRPEAALQDCERAAGEAESLGRAVFSPAPADGGTLGDRAAAHLVARKTARAACGSARVGIAGEADAEKRKGLEDRLAKAIFWGMQQQNFISVSRSKEPKLRQRPWTSTNPMGRL